MLEIEHLEDSTLDQELLKTLITAWGEAWVLRQLTDQAVFAEIDRRAPPYHDLDPKVILAELEALRFPDGLIDQIRDNMNCPWLTPVLEVK